MQQQEFIKPKLDGARFDGHSIPLELLKDFAVLEEMLIEVAKWKFRQQFPNRERVLRNFTAGIELHLAQVEEGSAIPAIVLAFSTLLPPQNVVYLDQAREEIISAISSAERGEVPTLPAPLLSYFDRFGRGLKENESMTFADAGGRPVHLTPDVRQRLIRAAHVPEWTEEAALRGRISEMDQARGSFELELFDGTKLQGPLSEQARGTLLQAFEQYREGRTVMVQAVAKRTQQQRLKSIELVQHISILDKLDVPTRLHELSKLEDGWLNGLGVAPGSRQLTQLGELFDTYFAVDLLLPHIYPTAEGGVQAEWSIDDWEASLEVDLQTFEADYQAYNMVTEEVREIGVTLDLPEAWEALEQQLRAIGAGLL